MYLLFDTETTGFFNKSLPLDHPDQARVIQLAAILCNKDFVDMGSLYTLIKPDGWTITPGAQAAHGITMEQCHEYGVPIREVLSLFECMVFRAKYYVGHNIPFDMDMVGNEYAVVSGTNIGWGSSFCTMRLMTDICKLPGKFPGKYKWPKLQEAYKVAFSRTFEGAHNALEDIKATKDIFRWLVTNGRVVVQ